MRILYRCIAAIVVVAGLSALLVATPAPVAAQCSMMGGGGGHDHGAGRSSGAAKSNRSEKKLRQSIDRLLSDAQGRELLVGALLDDRVFVQDFLRRLAALPEWKEMVGARVDAGPVPGAAPAPKPEAQSAARYACPMHADVISATEGDCPKCGMRLERQRVAGK